MKRIMSEIVNAKMRTVPYLVVLGIGAALVAPLSGCSRGKGAGAPGGGGFEMPPMPVEMATATRGKVTERYDTVGTIEASRATELVAEIDGIITSIPFTEGQPLRKGALIARLDDDQLRAEVDRTTALRDQRRLSFERLQVIAAQGAAAPQDLDDANAALKVAGADLALAQARLAKTRITAPFNGIVGARKVSPGEFVRSGTAIAEIADLDEIRVTFSASERYLSKLMRGAEVRVSTTAYPGVELTGRIAAVEPMLDPGTRSARVLAVVPNAEGRLRPGMSANVSAVLAERENAITIPSEAVFFQGNQALVYVVNPDGTVAPAPLALGTRLADVVEVVSGIEAGTQIVRTGHQKLFPGAKVMPAGAAGGGAPPAGVGAPADTDAAPDHAPAAGSTGK